MSYIQLEQEGYVGILTVNRPKALNALNSEVLSELESVLDNLDTDAIRVLIITGAGDKSFVAGADIAEMSTLSRKRARSSAVWATAPSARSRFCPSPSSLRSTVSPWAAATSWP